jgi:hypothetical protein
MLLPVAAILLSTAAAATPSSCQEVEGAELAVRSVAREGRPVLAWKALPGADQYRVEIESRIPEGQVLVSLDTQVTGTTFRPPQPLTDSRAAVKVRVTAGCPADDGSRLRERGATFSIDTSPLCPSPMRVAVSADRRGIEWSATPAAMRYDVTLLSPEDGAVRQRGQTQRPRFTLPATGEMLVAVVRPYCATGFGARASALVVAPKP